MPLKFSLSLAFLVAGIAAGCGQEASERVSRCTDRIVSRVHTKKLSRDALARYAERGYCRPFDRRGWIYDDGTLKLDAYTRGRKCSRSVEGEGTRPVSCDEVEHGILDCGLLRFVRKSEAQRYIASQRRKGPVRCDDGTPLEAIGAV